MFIYAKILRQQSFPELLLSKTSWNYNYSSETYWQVIIFAWMYSPEGVDNRYTKRITGENVGSTASVARNSHAMVTLVIFFSFFSRTKRAFYLSVSDQTWGLARRTRLNSSTNRTYVNFVRHPVCYVPLPGKVSYYVLSPYVP